MIVNTYATPCQQSGLGPPSQNPLSMAAFCTTLSQPAAPLATIAAVVPSCSVPLPPRPEVADLRLSARERRLRGIPVEVAEGTPASLVRQGLRWFSGDPKSDPKSDPLSGMHDCNSLRFSPCVLSPLANHFGSKRCYLLFQCLWLPAPETLLNSSETAVVGCRGTFVCGTVHKRVK
jgi:hypothetical protein